MKISAIIKKEEVRKIIEKRPEIVLEKQIKEVRKDVITMQGKIDLLLKTESGEYYIIDIKTTQNDERKEKVLRLRSSLLDDLGIVAKCIICEIENTSTYREEDEIIYLNLWENKLFLQQTNDLLISKLEEISNALNSKLKLEISDLEVKTIDRRYIEDVKKILKEGEISKGELNKKLSNKWKVSLPTAIKRLEKLQKNGIFLIKKNEFRNQKICLLP